jgi:hypothetical protein
MAITFRTSQGTALTHAQMDENFSSVYFSSSIHSIPNSTSKELKLWFDNDTAPLTSHSIVLPAPGGSGTVTITGDVDNRVLTAAGNGTIQGEQNLAFDGSLLALAGRFDPIDSVGNLSIGTDAGLGATVGGNILIGGYAGQDIGGTSNLALGFGSLTNADAVASTVAVGDASMGNLTTGINNTALGFNTAEQVGTGNGNVYIGRAAGPATSTISQNNKLYINNSADDTPLILGDFSTGQVTIHSQVSASVFSGSFVGNGAGLTGVTSEWDGTLNGNAQITGSLIVSGAAGTTINFTGVSSISGSIFSGSFVGDGSGLTGITANSEWDGTRNGNAEITGSFIVSGSSPTISLRGVTTIDQNIRIYNPTITSISIGQNALQSTTATESIGIGRFAGVGATNGPSISIGTQAGQRANAHTVYIGKSAGLNNTGEQVVSIGGNTLFNAQYAAATVAIGFRALQGLGTGKLNTVVGDDASSNLKNGAANTSIGANNLRNLVEGDFNTSIGYEAGSMRVTQGSGNVYLGPFTGRPDVPQEDNQLYIDNSQREDALIRGDFGLRTLTLNALIGIIPNLIDINQDPAGYNNLSPGALYKDHDFVLVKPL